MAHVVRISDDSYKAAQKAAKLEHRTIQGQLDFWLLVGRTALENPDLPIEMIVNLLQTDIHDTSDCTPYVPFQSHD